MGKGIAFSVAASICIASAGVALTRDNGYGQTINQRLDQVDARIADLKAQLRLSEDQGKHWADVQSALHDIAKNRAKRTLAAAADVETGRAFSDPSGTKEDNAKSREVSPDRKLDAAAPDDIDEMQRSADNLTTRAAEVRKLAAAVKPLYDSLDDHQRRRLVQFVRDDFWTDENLRGQRR
jgi:hypothetical protein